MSYVLENILKQTDLKETLNIPIVIQNNQNINYSLNTPDFYQKYLKIYFNSDKRFYIDTNIINIDIPDLNNENPEILNYKEDDKKIFFYLDDDDLNMMPYLFYYNGVYKLRNYTHLGFGYFNIVIKDNNSDFEFRFKYLGKKYDNGNIMFIGDYISSEKGLDNGNLMFIGDYITPANPLDNGNLMFIGDYLPVSVPVISKVDDTIIMSSVDDGDIYYTFNSSSVPSDPTTSDNLYSTAIPYVAGYYKAIVKLGSDYSIVVSKSFERAPEDYIHYYPLTTDFNFNDVVGSNDLNSSATITGSGAVINGGGQYMTLSSAITLTNFSISLSLTISSPNNNKGIIGTNNNNFGYALYDGGVLKYWSDGTPQSFPMIPLSVGVYYNIIVTKSGNQLQYFVNNIGSIVQTGIDKPIYVFGGIAGFSGYECYGTYRDIKIFDRVLTQEEITELYNLG